MKAPPTPFPVTGYYGPEYFCDREVELKQLKNNIEGGLSTSLIALRRLGKTALIKHLFFHLRSKYNLVYIDILPTESLNGMLNRLSTAIASAYSEKSGPGKKVWDFLKSLRPVISYDSLSGLPQVTIRSSPEESRNTLTELFLFMEKQSKPVVIAIDEFQQILEYPEKQTDAWLRSVLQELTSTSFIFSGSQQHLMTDLFGNPDRPFFRTTQFMKIGKLDIETYSDFIIGKFSDHSKSLSRKIVTEMIEWADGHTYYVQLLCNRVFLSSAKKVTEQVWKEEADRILKEQEFVFYNYREMLTKPQWGLLKAIAIKGRVYQPTSSGFVSGNDLGNPSTVLRSLKALERMDLIYREADEEGISYYGVYDIVLSRWLERRK